ncbi:probable basic-leucine zipper transcription factor D [Macrosteles quadrilineatus]|uniref:probable basic-leucine zipper transcription factor D n=1 Tax=Macrosteles quadrilineatus TaxID=74068 RepID=UPI0023E23F51|nr:probable basic-leucine zipper transcription factor D [Macrosteles quadrilineatus]
MEYAKKMVVVPQELIERLRNSGDNNNNNNNNNKNNNNDNIKSSSNRFGDDRGNSIDNEMHRILTDKTLSDYEKWKQYQQVLQRFLHFASVNRQPISIPIIETSTSSSSSAASLLQAASASSPPPGTVEEIVDTFSKTYKPDVRNLLRFIVREGSVINWDKDFAVYVRNEKIPDSNIVDILHCIVRVRMVDYMPAGWYEVMNALRDMNVPKEYINNSTALQYLGAGYRSLRGDVASAAASSPIISSAPRTPMRDRLRSAYVNQQRTLSPTSPLPSLAAHRRQRTQQQQDRDQSLSPLDRWEPFSP